MSLEKIQALVADDLIAVEKEMCKAVQSDVPLIRDISQHIFQGGKRVRPLLVMLMSHVVGSAHQPQILLSSIIEFIHTATLLHDDVVDNSRMRRGSATANDIWGNEASVLVGDFIYSRAFQLLVTLNDHTLMKILAHAINVMAEGEVLQLMSRHDIGASENTYFNIIHAKTAILFQAACEMTATLAKKDTLSIEYAANFGRHLGLVFQLIDDALDYTGDAQQLGKNIGDDLAEGKMTLPLIHCLQQANATEQQYIHQAIATGELTQLKEIQAIIEKYASVSYTLDKAAYHQQQALQALQHFPASRYTQALVQLTEFMMKRAH